MATPHLSSCRARPRVSRNTRRFLPGLEQLETRNLLSAVAVPEIEPNDSLNHAQSLGALDNATAVPVRGIVGNGAYGAADIDWYTFTVANPTHVHLSAVDDDSSGLDAVLTLYNTDPGNTFDPGVALDGHRLLLQTVGTDGVATLDRDLGAGTYFVAVSGKGNQNFYPLLPDSGLDGETGGYLLRATGTTLVSPSLVLAADIDAPQLLDAHGNPVPDSSGNPQFTAAPLVLRFDTSAPIDPASDIQLLDPNGNNVFINFNIDENVNELEIMPLAALAPNPNGEYQVIAYNSDDSVVQFTYSFTVVGIEGNTSGLSDDTVATAHALGDVTNGRFVQASGAIGIDPYYDPINNFGDPNSGNPSNQVDLYTFHVGGTGNYAIAAEVDAGRIGSSLDPALTLFKLNADGSVVVIAGNDNTADDQTAELDVGQVIPKVPLFTDAALFAGLQPGNYVLAVSAGFNYADPAIGRTTGENGNDPTQMVFDPTVSHSGTTGGSTVGDYVLSFRVQAASVPPTVKSVTVTSTDSAGAYPTGVTVQFSGPVNLQQLAFVAFEHNLPSDLAPIFIQGPGGTTYLPRMVSYDPTTFQAQFILLDRLPTGSYQLHLSGSQGLTDFAGNPLKGNTPGGDFVDDFTVSGAAGP